MTQQQIQNNKSCPRRGKGSLITDAESAELFCGKCGFIIDERISNYGPERTFSDSNVSKSRTGDRTSLTRHDKGLSTVIGPLTRTLQEIRYLHP